MSFTIDHVSASYGGNTVIHDVCLEVPSDRFVGVFGHNGSGKSTLLKCMIGRIGAMAGDLRFDGHPVVPDKVHRNVMLGIGFVPQTQNVFPNLSVWDCLRIAAMNHQPMDVAVLDLFPAIANRRRARAGSLSGGQQQMLAVAMALMTRPKVVLLDEPTAGLAPNLANEVLNSLQDINRKTGTGIIIVEQNVVTALRMAERAIIMKGGRVAYDGPTTELQRQEDLWHYF
ncbi:MAG TPA: ATP-binding cassette domain-containing protein [Rhodopila sp.]|uniref:ABC transporter ATP-binding protein n=1 Tax=Rhodopila sp. TaxID=2480087 RepID=UPI002C34DA24|nr:ATP-binding cassette domain-containing protein [Rhodopila sp.]HVY16937.1 ATP-binding cassette domain-containing protein [Rhodopila sp.]